MNETSLEKFNEELAKFDTAVFTTLNEQGDLHARPMAIAEVEKGGDIIFLTDESSGKAHELERNPKAGVVCQNGWKDTVAIRGTATLFRDEAKAKQIWRKTFQAWFPGGPTDPRLVMIRFRGEVGEYWDNSGVQGIKYLFKAAKAVATGTRPAPDPVDEHGVVKLK